MERGETNRIKQLLREERGSEISNSILLDSLREKGISDLETFVERNIQAHTESQAQPLVTLFPETQDMSPEDAITEIVFSSKAATQAKEITHNSPKMPFVLGNSYYKPSEISKFNGRRVHFVWDRNMIQNGFLRVVTDRDEYRAFLAGSVQPKSTESTEYIPYSHVPGAGHTFYQHINFGGYVLNLAYRHAYPDLTKVTMSGFWFWATSWNDQISSLKTGSGPAVLWEHIMNPYPAGASMTVGANTNIPWIGSAWNDRISCITAS